MTSEELLKELYSRRKLLQWQRRWEQDKVKRHEMQMQINDFTDKIGRLRRMIERQNAETPESNRILRVETPERNAYKGF